MKTTIKIILVIALFCSTATVTLADGEQGVGSRCTTECSDPVDPNEGGNSSGSESFETIDLTITNDENIELSENDETLSLMNWFLSFFR